VRKKVIAQFDLISYLEMDGGNCLDLELLDAAGFKEDFLGRPAKTGTSRVRHSVQAVGNPDCVREEKNEKLGQWEREGAKRASMHKYANSGLSV